MDEEALLKRIEMLEAQLQATERRCEKMEAEIVRLIEEWREANL